MDALHAEAVDGPSVDDRYNKLYKDGKTEFFLSDYQLAEDEARFVILKVLEQSVRDYCTLYNAESQREKDDWESAKGFLFDDDYTVDWGEWEITPEELLDLVDLDINWVREQAQKKFEEKNGS